MTPDEAITSEADSIRSSIARSPREFAKLFDWEFAFMGLADQMKLRAWGDPLRRKELETRVTEETEEATSAWAIWNTYHRDDAALTGNERNLARGYDRRVQEYVERTADDALMEHGVEGLRIGGAL